MFDPDAMCPECPARLLADGSCRECGYKTPRPLAPAKPLSTAPSPYRETTPPADGVHHDDPEKCTVRACREPVCRAAVAAKIAEGKRIAASAAWDARFASRR